MFNGSKRPVLLLTFDGDLLSVLDSGILSQSSDLPAATIHLQARLLNSGLSAQAVGQPQTRMPISQGEDFFVVKIYSDGSNMLIFCTSIVLSICGLHPPQYFMSISFTSYARWRDLLNPMCSLRYRLSLLCSMTQKENPNQFFIPQPHVFHCYQLIH